MYVLKTSKMEAEVMAGKNLLKSEKAAKKLFISSRQDQ